MIKSYAQILESIRDTVQAMVEVDRQGPSEVHGVVLAFSNDGGQCVMTAYGEMPEMDIDTLKARVVESFTPREETKVEEPAPDLRND